MTKPVTTLTLVSAVVLSIAISRLLNQNSNGPEIQPVKLVHQFKIWQREHAKVYDTPSEELYRLSVFKQNLEIIEDSNRRFTAFKLGLNQFSDLTSEEFEAKYMNPGMGSEPIPVDPKNPPNTENARPGIDWRDAGAVTQPVNQGSCNAGYAFAAVGAIEGRYFLNGHHLQRFSEQQIIDCSHSGGNRGCSTGTTWASFTYLVSYGATTNQKYPYKASQHQCHYRQASMEVQEIISWKMLPADQGHLLNAVSTQPTTVYVNATPFQHYHSGVYIDTAACPSNSRPNTFMLAAGYGVDMGHKFWLLKSSWGVHWGDFGYIKILRSSSGRGICAVASNAATVHF